ncbi:pyrimidine-nucleoside phosphorylase [Alteribacillus sp. HJP-4]|uniref:pyrimidine-nucleoside phosphorylase n=1 Tax=Alteribacillus sp. HJP-4 TaxID=2775394 RepID=UPI0035CCCB77
MRMVDVVQKKRDSQKLTTEEIYFFVNGYTEGKIPDYQVSALMMAIYFNGMDKEETADLTRAMASSGDMIDLSPIQGFKVDKHSTGGVGDKTSFIVAPLVASVGVPVAKMSGRGLGHTGGTIDKLESISGFQTELSREQFINNVNTHKLSLVGQSGNLAPADKKIYALRDVTATVDSLPLIASSIMSKKIASGADGIVLDVKTGSGAFMKTLEESQALAEAMVTIGNNVGKKTVAVISDMNQPLGFEIGNANEIKEAVEVLQGKNIQDLRELSLVLGSHMAVLAGVFDDTESAFKELEKNLENGKAFEAFKNFVIAQGGDVDQIVNVSKLPEAKYHIDVKADTEGFVSEIDAESIGIAAMYLGAGRASKDDLVNHAVGITLNKKIGDSVSAGETIAIIHSNDREPNKSIMKIRAAYNIENSKTNPNNLINEVIS